MNETLLAMIRANTRLPVDTIGDVYSLANCNDIGCRRLVEMMDEFKLDSLDTLGEHICSHSERGVLEEIAKLPHGTWRYEMTLDGYEEPIKLVATTTVSAKGIHVDYTGTSATSKRGINVPMAYTLAYTSFGLGCIVAARIPNNAGSLAPLTVSAPPGTILNAGYPLPVLARHVIGQMLPDMVFGCLRQAIPQSVPAEGTSCLWNIIFRGPRDSQDTARYGFAMTMTSNGGTGARPMKDGLSATAYPSGVKGTPVEIAEAGSPVLFWRKELRPDSGGPGRTRGGMGQLLEIESTRNLPFEIAATFDRIKYPPRGRDGGKDGASGYVGLGSGQALNGKGIQMVPAGDRLVIMTPGGGGFGDPKVRDRAAVRADLEAGLVSPKTATEIYGLGAEAAE
jgi:N-methylhydantoinase B